MSNASVLVSCEKLLASGQLDEALHVLHSEIIRHPSDASLRTFMFKSLALAGDWAGSAAQLEVAAALADKSELPVRAYGFALQGELEREAVMKGTVRPTIIGELAAWHAPLIESLRALCDGSFARALELRAKALDAATTRLFESYFD